jgi:CheY-like chemotaxis protein
MPTRILVVDDSPTIRKVVCAILDRHGYESLSAGDGQDALDVLSRDAGVDLVLLDFVMPKVNGYQFCRALREQERFKALPVVLMSAKSDKIREQFVHQTGALDAITKPFDAQALVAVVQNTLKRVELGNARLAAAEAFEEDEQDSRKSSSDEPSRAARAGAELAAQVARVIAPALKGLPPAAAGDELMIALELTSGLSMDLLREIGVSLRDFDFGERGPVVLSGDLESLAIGAVLQMLQVERMSGLLSIVRYAGARSPGSEVTVTWRAGLVDFVQSRGAGDEFRLGRYFVEEGLVTPDEIEAFLRRREQSEPPRSSIREFPSTRPLLGDMLVEAGKVTSEQLRGALVRQASELIYEVIRWHRGRFELRKRGASATAERAKLSLPVAAAVMEGFRRVDEWRVVEEGLGSFETVLQRDPMAIAAIRLDELPRPERGVLGAIDGERTVREIVAASHMSSFDACRILRQLIEARLVRPRVS